jgi:hypothetical protein
MVFYLFRDTVMDPKPGTDSFAPDRWAMPSDPMPAPEAKKRRPCRRRTERFLRGPVPWSWLHQAMTLPGKALAVGVMLWQLRGVTGRRTVLFCLSRAATDGIPTTTARRAVRELERAGLVTVQRKPGRGLDVTILDVPAAGRKREEFDC